MTLWLKIITFFFLYIEQSAKSRSQDREERIKYNFNSNSGSEIRNHHQAKCPMIPKCHWARFEDSKLKVQQGAQSSVTMLIDKFNNERVIKKIFSSKEDFWNELQALSCIRIGQNPLLVFPLCVDLLKMTIVLEWGGEGDLTRWDLFRDELVPYSFKDVVKLSGQIIAAVAASHRRGVLHGDIKPENFVINLNEKAIKLIDFGLSARIGEYRIMTQGTPQTMAPEVAFPDFFSDRLYTGVIDSNPLKNDIIKSFKDNNRPQYIREAMDWWSVGVTIHYLFAKYFANESKREIKSKSPTSNIKNNYPETQSQEEEEDEEDEEESINNEFIESDEHYFPYKIIWSHDGEDIAGFRYRPIPKSFPFALKNLLDRLMAWDPNHRNFDRSRIKLLLKHEFFEKIDWNEIDSQLSI